MSNFLDDLENLSTQKQAAMEGRTVHKQQSVGQRTANLNTLDAAIGTYFDGQQETIERAVPNAVSAYGKGSNAILKSAGDLGVLLGASDDNWASTAGQSGIDYWKSRENLAFREDDRARRDAIDSIDNQFGKTAVAFWETVKNPALASSTLVEQVPSMVGPGVFGKAAKALAALFGASSKAKKATGIGAALGAGAGLAAGDAGGGAYESLMELPEEIWDANPELAERVNPEDFPTMKQYMTAREEAKKEISLRNARIAGGLTAVSSLVSQKIIPDGMALDKILSGNTGKFTGSAIVNTGRVGLAEASQEGFEEGLGQRFSNQAVWDVDPSQDLNEGVGEAVGIAAVGGGGIGGAAGGLNTKVAQVAAAGRRDNEMEALYDNAAETGDVSELIDPKKQQTYNVPAAYESLRQYVAKEQAAGNDPVNAIKQRDSLLAEQKERVAKATKARAAINPENIEATREQISELEATIADPETPAELKSNVETLLELQKEELANAEEQKKSPKKLDSSLEKERERLNLMREFDSRALEADAVSATEGQDIEADVEAVTSGSEEAPAAAGRTVNFMMQNPDAVSDDNLETLASSEYLSSDEREFVKSTQASRKAIGLLSGVQKVQKQVLNGDGEFLGLRDYRARISNAIRTGDVDTATANLDKLREFTDQRTNKKAAITAAVAKAKQNEKDGNKKQVFVLRDPSSEKGYRVTEVKPKNWNNKTAELNGGFIVHPTLSGINGAQRTLQYMDTEVDALTKTTEALNRASNLTFSRDTVTEQELSTNDTDIPADAEVAQESTDEIDQESADDIDQQLKDFYEKERQAEATTEADQIQETETSETTGETQETATPDNQQTEEESASPEVAEDARVIPDVDHRYPGTTPKAVYENDGYNPLSNNFKQTVREGNPLTAIKDFAAEAYKGGVDLNTELLERFNDSGRSITSGGINALQSLFSFNERVRNNSALWDFEHKSGLYGKTNYLNYFRDEAGDIPGNVITAITAAGFKYVADNGGGRGYNTREDAARILGISEEQDVPYDAMQKIFDKGNRRDFAIREMGTEVFNSLGLSKRADIPSNEKEKLILALGSQAMTVMISEGVLIQEQIVLGKYMPDGDFIGESTSSFLRLNRDENGELINTANVIYEDMKGSDKVMEQVFNQKPKKYDPPLETGTYNRTNRDNVNKPESLNDAAETDSDRPWRIRELSFGMFQSFPEDMQLRFFGAPEPRTWFLTDIEEMSYKGKLQNAESQLADLKDFYENLQKEQGTADVPFYVVKRIWSQHRVGVQGSKINPQGNKGQRYLMRMDEWETTFNPNKLDTKSAILDRDFRLSVAQGMGFATDKNRIEDSLATFDKYINSAKGKLVVSAARKLAETGSIQDLTDAEYEAFTDRVIDEEQMHTFHAATEFGRYLNAKAAGTEFTTDITYEVDGVANGPALSHAMLGAITSDEQAESFGFFPEGSNYNSSAEYSSDVRTTDLYEKVAETWVRNIGRALNAAESDALKFFLGEFVLEGRVTPKARKALKTPITALLFGSSESSAANSLAQDIVDAYHSKLTSAYDTRDRSLAIQAIRNMETLGVHFSDHTLRNRDDIKNFGLTPKNYKAAVNEVTKLVLKPTKETLRQHFKRFLLVRDEINATADAVFQRYSAARKFIINQKLKAKIESGEVAATGKNKSLPVQTLSPDEYAEIDAELFELYPRMHTMASKLDNDLSKGLDITKAERVTLRPDFDNDERNLETAGGMAFTSEVVYSRPAVPFIDTKGESKQSKSIKSYGTIMVPSAPGVGTVPKITHANDSFIASSVYGKIAGLNVHDAIFFPIGGLEGGANAFNEATLKLLASYSVAGEVMAMGERSLAGVEALEATYPGISEAIESGNMEATAQIEGFRKMAAIATYQARQRMERTVKIDQYSFEGGAFEVNEESLAAVRADVPVNDYPTPEDPTSDIESEPPGDWGPTGKPSVASDPFIEELLRKYGSLNAKQVVSVLRQGIKNSVPGNEGRVQQEMLNQIAEHLPRDLEVVYVTPETPYIEGAPQGALAAGSRGWYSIVDNKIYVKSSDFAGAGITPETVLHELLHAATAHRLETVREYYGPGKRVPKGLRNAYEAFKRLDSLLVDVREFVEAEGLSSQYAPAMESVDELISWGLTNRAFQRDVLSKMDASPLENETAASKSGFRSFIDSLLGLLFKSRSGMDTALGSLIINTSAIFEVSPGSRTTPKHLMMKNNPNDFTSHQIFNALGDPSNPMSPDEARRLKGLLTTTADAVYGAAGVLRDAAIRRSASTADDVYLNSLKEGKAPFTAEAAKVIGLDQQTAFVTESIEATIRQSTVHDSLVRRDMKRVWAAARKPNGLRVQDFHDGDWSRATAQEKAAAKRRHDYIMTPKRGADTADAYLSRFAAVALTFRPVVARLEQLSLPDATPGDFTQGSLGEMLKRAFSRLLDLISQLRTGARTGNDLRSNLTKVVMSLASIEARKQSSVEKKVSRTQEAVNAAAKKVSEGSRKVVETAIDKLQLDKSRLRVVRAGAAIAKTVAGDRVDLFFQGVQETRDRAMNRRFGLGAETVNEFRGMNGTNEFAFKLLAMSNKVEQTRKQIMSDTQDFVTSLTGEVGRETSRALHRTIVKLDLQALMSHFTDSEIMEIIQDDLKLKAAVAQMEGQLDPIHANDWKLGAKVLAHHLNGHGASAPGMQLNAHNIAYLANRKDKLTDNRLGDAAIPIIDTLTSLYGLQYADPADLKALRDTLATQGQDPANNGIVALLRYHGKVVQDARDNNFRGNFVSQAKGYAKEVYNPHVDVKVTDDPIEIENLINSGYVKYNKEDLPRDKRDSVKPGQSIWVADGKGLNTNIVGIFSNTQKHRFGTTVDVSEVDLVGIENDIEDFYDQDADSFDPRTVKETFLVPSMRANGKFASFRYIMEDTTKRDLLDADGRIEKTLAATTGSMFDKLESARMNKEAVSAFREQYVNDKRTVKSGYLEFGPNSSDPVIQERWDMLPPETKDHIRQVWGRDGMLVKSDLYNIAFGYRKYSLSDTWSIPQEERNAIQKVFTKLVEVFFGKKAAVRVAQGGQVWSDLVRMTKDIWVIKNLFTLVGNEISNFTMLMWAGVPIHKYIKNKVSATVSTIQYQRDRKEHDMLQRQIDARHLNGTDLADAETRMVELEESMEKNPIKELVDAGMFQTLIEDIDHEGDEYAYTTRLSQWVDDKTSVIPDSVKRGVRTIMLAHDTPVYNVLNQATILSDFTSRYILHEHMVESGRMGPEESLLFAQEAFVDYDIPTHRALQYANDIGLLWFTKYYIRIQKVILRLWRENPANAFGLLALENFIPGLQSLMDSGFWNDLIPGRAGAGAIELGTAVDDIITLHSMQKIM